MKTVLILSFSPLARDARILRQIQALGSDYRLISCGFGPPPVGVARHYQIPDSLLSRPAGIVGLGALSLRMHDLAERRIPAVKSARNLLTTADFDLLLANDVETVALGLDLAESRPVVADLHEYAPGQGNDWRVRTLLTPHRSWICRELVPKATRVTTVAPGIATEYRQQFGLTCEVVTNAGSFRDPKPRMVTAPIRLVHHGTALRGRLLERMILGAGGISGVELDLYLMELAGDSGYLDELKMFASEFGNVSFLEPVEYAAIPTMLDGYDAGLYLLPPTNFNHLHALPNKYFEFIQSGLPVITGPSPEMAALTREHGVGLVLSDWEVPTLRHALTQLEASEVASWQEAVCRAAIQLSSANSKKVIRRVVAESLGSAH